jgi:hypothetical protein
MLCLSLILLLNLIDSNLSIDTTVIPYAHAQATTLPYFPNLYDPYNQFNFNNPFGHQQISPWFPSIPAIACGAGLFSFNIEGLPDKGVDIPINDEELMALRVQLDKDNRGLFFTSSNDISGKITVGKDNIKTNQGDDFEVKNLFNNCRTLAFSSTGDVKIKTPPPATAASNKVNTIILPSPFSGTNNYNPYPYFSTPTTGFPYSYPATPGVDCQPGYRRSSDGSLCIRY